MKLSVRTIIILAAVTIGAGVTAGVSRAAEPLVPSHEASKGAMQVAPETHGLFQLIGQALNDAGVRPDQKDAVKKLGEQVAVRQADVDKARTAFAMGLADELESGHIDRAALEPKIDALAEARQTESPVLRKSLVSLHDLFDAQQRNKFADSLEKIITEHREHKSTDKLVDKWGKDLDLTDAQKQELRALLEKSAQSGASEHQTIDKMVAAFRTDSFDPEKILPEREVSAKTKDRLTRMASTVAAIAAILNPEQRAKAAMKIREAFGAKAEKTREGAGPDEDVESTPEELIYGGGFFRPAVGLGWGYPVARGIVAAPGFAYSAPIMTGGLIL